jgi:hypothetical protein
MLAAIDIEDVLPCCALSAATAHEKKDDAIIIRRNRRMEIVLAEYGVPYDLTGIMSRPIMMPVRAIML